jgi:predicted dinucleotide-binding enzyme
MRIGIFGAGGMADALGGRWVAAGHEVLIGARDHRKAHELAVKLSAKHGTWTATAEFGEAILLAVPAPAVLDVLSAAGAALRGKTLIDCTNAVGPGAVLTVPNQAARIAAAVPEANVVKAFNLCHVDVWRMTPPVFDGRSLAVPICGDDPGALELVRTLAKDIGCEPVDSGGIDRAHYLEAAMVFAVHLWFAGHDAQACFPPLVLAG